MMTYEPKNHWDSVANSSSPGRGDSPGKFGNYNLPSWKTDPQWWEYTEKDSKILDIGSGIGAQVGKLSERGIFAVGVDVSPKLINIARENCLAHGVNNPKFVLWEGKNLPFKSNSFDRITTNTVLQHVTNDDQLEKIFKEVSRVSSINGLFLISECMSPMAIGDAPHVKMRSRKDYIKLASTVNLTMVKYRRYAKSFLTVAYIYGRIKRFIEMGKMNSTAPPKNHQEVIKTGRCKRETTTKIKKIVDKACDKIDHVLNKLNLSSFITQDTIIFKKYK